MRRLTLTLLALVALVALAPSARAQYATPQSAPRAAPVAVAPPATPLYYQAPAPAAMYYAPAARTTGLVEVPLVPGKPPRAPRGPLKLEVTIGMRFRRDPALVPVAVHQGYYEPQATRALEAPPKDTPPAPGPRGALQAPAKEAGGIDPEPAWAVAMRKRQEEILERLEWLEDAGDKAGDRAPAPPTK